MSQKQWIVIFAVVIAAMAGLYVFLTHGGQRTGRVVAVYSGSELVRTVDLDTAEDQVFTVTDRAGGANTVCVKDGEIFVAEADCPDGICMRHGPLLENGTPIVCLPNRLVIRWAESSAEVDN